MYFDIDSGRFHNANGSIAPSTNGNERRPVEYVDAHGLTRKVSIALSNEQQQLRHRLRPMVYRACLEESDGDTVTAQEACNIVMGMDDESISTAAENGWAADLNQQQEILAVLNAELAKMRAASQA